MAIDVDPAVIQGLLTDARYIRVVITPGTGGATCLCAVMAVFTPRYKGATFTSAT